MLVPLILQYPPLLLDTYFCCWLLTSCWSQSVVVWSCLVVLWFISIHISVIYFLSFTPILSLHPSRLLYLLSLLSFFFPRLSSVVLCLFLRCSPCRPLWLSFVFFFFNFVSFLTERNTLSPHGPLLIGGIGEVCRGFSYDFSCLLPPLGLLS